MSLEEYATYRELQSQTSAWAQALEIVGAALLPEAASYSLVLFTGCGSTYYLSLAAAALYQELTGRSARAVPASELLLNPQVVLPADATPLLVAVSRSGTTTETVRAAEQFKAQGRGDVLVISTRDDLLSRPADWNVLLPRAQEDSVAQTRSFASMFVAASALAARMAGRSDLLQAMQGLPPAGERLLGEYAAYAREIGSRQDYDRFYFLGSGLRYGLACEANLKLKEMTLTHSEPFHFLEFRHGPMSMVNQGTVIVGLLSDANRPYEQQVLSEMRALGARVVGLAESHADVAFASQVPESVRGVLYLPVLQLLAFHRALAKGINPDRPKNLTAVVQLNL